LFDVHGNKVDDRPASVKQYFWIYRNTLQLNGFLPPR